MNQPQGSCFSYIHEVVNLADQLKNHRLKKQHRPQQDIDIESEDSMSQPELEPAADMDCDSDTMENGTGSGARFVQEYDGAART